MTWMLRLWAVVFLSFALVAQGVAQDTNTQEFDRWSRLATQGETMLDRDSAPDAGLSGLRERIVEFRSEFDRIRTQNVDRIRTLREQIAALGPVSEDEGAQPEAPQVKAKRDELTEQLEAFLEPVQRAEAELVRAEALIGQIDTVLRERQTERLMSVSPTPLNPVNWRPAVVEFVTATHALWRGQSAHADINFRQTMPVAFILGALGLVLILRGRRWSGLIVEKLQQIGARGFGIWRFLVSLLRIVLPFAGLILLAMALNATELFSTQAEGIIEVIAGLGGSILVIRWISERVFARDNDEALLLLSVQERQKIRFHVVVITLMMVASALISQVLDTQTTAPATQPVLLFVPLLIASLALFRMGALLRRYDVAPTGNAEAVTPSAIGRIVRAFGTGAVAVGLISPLLMAAGYFKAADALLPPFITTLACLGLVMALQRFLADVYGAITGQGAAARDALLPVLFGFALLVLATPFLALIWGARVTDLTEMWSAFSRGFSIGETRISPSDFIAFAVIFTIGYVITRLLQSALKTNVLPKTKIDIGGQNAIVAGLGYVGIFLAALAAITGAGIDLSSIAIVAGALSVGIGFGLQNIVSNFVSGIILLIERPISEGDWIEVGGNMGYVRDISVRSTRIETFAMTDVIIPNADLVSGTVTNYTRGNTTGRLIVPVGVAYGSDTKQVEKILREVAEAQPMVLLTPPPSVLFIGLGASTYDFEIRVYLRDVNWMMGVKSDINHQIVARFAEANIEVAFPQMDLWVRNAEALQSKSPNSAAAPSETST